MKADRQAAEFEQHMKEQASEESKHVSEEQASSINDTEHNDTSAVNHADSGSQMQSTKDLPESQSQNETHSENSKHPIEDLAESQHPPKKIRKPLSRVSQAERDAKTRELRERIDKRDETTIVKDHYNQRPNQGTERRRQSPIIKLRSFNNWIKSVLIGMFVTPGCVVLDLGCGKGGDTMKWKRGGSSGFIGIDVAEVSVEQAKERFEQERMRSARQRNRRPFWADFCVGDAFAQDVEDIVHPDAFPVDIVSSQFCLHYAYKSEEQVYKALANISRALRPGGVFIGTIPNSDVINKHIRKLEPTELKFGNSVYSVEFAEPPPRDGVYHPPYGHKYTFFLEDAVGNVPEYVVPFESFRNLAESEEFGLELLYKKPFLRMFEEEIDRDWNRSLAQKMNVYTSSGQLGIEGDEREACGFYLAFAFRKKY